MNYTRQQIRDLHRENAKYPATLQEVPKWQWPTEAEGYNSAGSVPRIRILRSQQFLCQVFQEQAGIIRLSVCRTEWDVNRRRWKEDITWEQLQGIKRECGYGDLTAVEVYPEDVNIVNVANMRHLWVLPIRVPFAWVKS